MSSARYYYLLKVSVHDLLHLYYNAFFLSTFEAQNRFLKLWMLIPNFINLVKMFFNLCLKYTNVQSILFSEIKSILLQHASGNYVYIVHLYRYLHVMWILDFFTLCICNCFVVLWISATGPTQNLWHIIFNAYVNLKGLFGINLR